MSYSEVGKVWTPASFRQHLRSVDLSWAKGVTMHHTAAPSLATRPRGLTIQHIENIAAYYQRELGWSRGPHLFIDEDQIFGMSPMGERGIHAVSFNRTHIGIEVLGNYDSETPDSGRGQACWDTAAEAAAAILLRAGWTTSAINGHRDDPRTGKSCPGRLVDLDKFRQVVSARMSVEPTDPTDRVPDPDPEALKVVSAIEWQLEKLKELL